LIRERRRIEGMIRRGLIHEGPAAADDLVAAEILPVLERLGQELEDLLGGRRAPRTEPAAAAPPRPTLAERRDELDRLLREELERQGIVVTGQDIARVVGSAVGREIQWAD
jgi:hypothetical protein